MTDNKLMHVVVLDRIGDTKAPDVVAAFDEKDDVQTFIDAQENNENFTLLSVPLNPPVTPVALPWYAYFDMDSHKLRELSRNGNLGHDWVQERLGLVRSSYSGLNLEIWFLATGREDAEQTAQNMFRSVMLSHIYTCDLDCKMWHTCRDRNKYSTCFDKETKR